MIFELFYFPKVQKGLFKVCKVLWQLLMKKDKLTFIKTFFPLRFDKLFAFIGRLSSGNSSCK